MSETKKPDAVGTFIRETDRDYREIEAETRGRPDEAEDIEASEDEENRRSAGAGETYKDPKSL